MLNILLKEIAKKENLFVQDSASLKNLVELMNLNKKGVVVILDGLKPVGILTERDVVEVLYDNVSLDDSVGKYKKDNLVATSEERTVGYALDLTLENKIRRVIVVDNDGNFSGVVTQQDLLKYLEEDFYRLTIKVKHIVKNIGHLLSVPPEASLHEVLKLMVVNKISAVPVIEKGLPVGIITEKDILNLACSSVSLESRVDQHMTSPVDTARMDSLLVEVVEVMNYKNFRRVIVVDDDGKAANIVTLRDVIENLEGDYNKFLERKLESAKEILNLLPEMMIEVTDTGEEQLIIWVNDKVVSRFGRQLIDKPISSFIPSGTWERIYATLKKFSRIEQIKLKKEDSIYELSGFFISTFGKMDQGRFQLIMRDITEDIKLSTVDPLTDIYNRRFINEFLVKELERCKRLDKQFSVVISDIDDFKIINDTYGHLAGDKLLKTLSCLITGTVRNVDVVGRYGGDEFMMILPDTGPDTAYGVIDRLRSEVEQMQFALINGVNVKITTSFGIASFPDDGTSLDDLLVIADERLYKAKGMGKNKVA